MHGSALPLLRTKTETPARRHNALVRERLIERLNAGRDARLVLVSAPAGYGKTTALADWCRSLDAHGVSVAWLTLDVDDNDPARYVAYLEAACGLEDTALPDNTDAGIAPRIAQLINGLATRDGYLVLVLDDYQVITSEASHAVTSALLEHGPRQLRVAIGTRVDPPLGLARLRGRDALLELRAPDLRLTHAEIGPFAERICHVTLPADEVAALSRHSEGWPTGLQLLAHAVGLLETESSAQLAVDTAQQHVFAYFAEEVFDPLPPAVQTFLTRTAILERLSAGLCDVVLGWDSENASDSRRMLELLVRANLFVAPVAEAGGWFRYHPQFRAFLRARLACEPGALVTALHERASCWHAQHRCLSSAVEHAVASGNLTRARSLLHALECEPAAIGPLPSRTAMLLRGAPLLVASEVEPGLFVEPLSERELQVLRLVAGGAANQEIATAMMISVGTVKSHVNHILGKLAAHNRTEAAARARALGLLA